MELKDLNAFLHQHTGAKYFEADLKLFKEKFPESKLIKDFENTPEFKKAEYDERICAEMLMHQNACIDCIWENRGFYRDKNNFIKPLGEKETQTATISELEKALLDFDLSVKKPHYNTMKQFVYDFKLKIADEKGATYVQMLTSLQNTIIAKASFIAEVERLEAANQTGNDDASTEEGTNTDTATDAEAEKKSEDQDVSTQV